MENTQQKFRRDKPQGKLDDSDNPLGMLTCPDAEAGILGAIMAQPEAIMACITFGLEPKHFSVEKHQAIYMAIQEVSLSKTVKHIDQITIYNVATKTLGFTSIKMTDVSILAMKVVSSANIDSHMALVKSAYVRRTAHTLTQQLAKSLTDGVDVADALALFASETTSVVIGSHIDLPKPYMDIKEQIIERYRQFDLNPPGFRTGVPFLDSTKFVLLPGELTVIGARPGSGKTMLAVILAETHGKLANGDCIMFTAEMSAEELVDRQVARISNVSNSKIRQGHLNARDFNDIEAAINNPENDLINTHYRDSTVTLSLIKNTVQIWKAKGNKIKSIIIDYLQLMVLEPGVKVGNRDQEIGYYTRSLKAIAREEGISIILLSQLSRESAKGGKRAPEISDLRESGNIEQDADNVMLMYNMHDLYERLPEDDDEFPNGPTKTDAGIVLIGFNFVKRRAGATFKFRHWCDFRYFKYVTNEEAKGLSEPYKPSKSEGKFAPATASTIIDNFKLAHNEQVDFGSNQNTLPFDNVPF